MAQRENMGSSVEIGMIERVTGALRYLFTGNAPVWFGPQNPLPPMAPVDQRESVAGRQFDYPVGYNQRTRPRDSEPVTFDQMRALADGYDVMRLVIETRKDQMAKLKWNVKPKDSKAKRDARCDQAEAFLATPDKEHTWDEWLRMLLEDLFVIDAPTVYVRQTKGGALYALEPIDGSTIKRVIDEHGRTPDAPLPAYQQYLKGVPAIDYSRDELIYRPRNLRTHKIYGYSPVEQVIMTVNIAIRRQLNQLSYYTEGNVPNTIFRVPKEWNPDQIRQFQAWWDELTAGQSKHIGRFIPEGPDPIDTKAQALKDEYDEWLARIICFAFSIAPTPFIKQMNRATAETAHDAAIQEGLAPIMAWVKSLIDLVLVKYLGWTDLEFAWAEEEEINPIDQATVLDKKIRNGSMTLNEARAIDGREAIEGGDEPIIFTASGVITLKDALEQAKNPPPPPMLAAAVSGGGDDDEPPKPPKGGKDQKAEDKPEKLAKAAKVAPINRERPALVKARAKLDATLRKFLAAQAKDIAAQVVAAKESIGKADADDIRRILDSLNFDGWAVLSGDVEDIIQQMAKEGAAAAIAQIGIEDDQKIVELANEQAIDWAKDRAAEWVGKRQAEDGSLVDNPNAEWRIDETTREMLRSTVAKAMEQGLSNDELADLIEQDYAFSPERAEAIARTETAMADVAGNMIAYRESGMVTQKQWITGADCCDECQELDGETVGLDENFPNGAGDAPPLHPNCRCDVVPVVADDEPENDQ